MLTALAKHGRFDLELDCDGDLEVDDHHTAEDCALALGTAFDQALGERRGIRRFGHAYAPLDEALARAVVDFSGRPSAHVDLGFRRERIGEIATENLTHFFVSFATTARMTLHVDVLKGDQRPSPRRGGVQGAGPGPAPGGGARRLGRGAEHQGRAVSMAKRKPESDLPRTVPEFDGVERGAAGALGVHRRTRPVVDGAGLEAAHDHQG